MWGATPKEEPEFDKKDVKDIVTNPVKAKGGEKFGVGFGLGHAELN